MKVRVPNFVGEFHPGPPVQFCRLIEENQTIRKAVYSRHLSELSRSSCQKRRYYNAYSIIYRWYTVHSLCSSPRRLLCEHMQPTAGIQLYIDTSELFFKYLRSHQTACNRLFAGNALAVIVSLMYLKFFAYQFIVFCNQQ